MASTIKPRRRDGPGTPRRRASSTRYRAARWWVADGGHSLIERSSRWWAADGRGLGLLPLQCILLGLEPGAGATVPRRPGPISPTIRRCGSFRPSPFSSFARRRRRLSSSSVLLLTNTTICLRARTGAGDGLQRGPAGSDLGDGAQSADPTQRQSGKGPGLNSLRPTTITPLYHHRRRQPFTFARAIIANHRVSSFCRSGSHSFSADPISCQPDASERPEVPHSGLRFTYT